MTWVQTITGMAVDLIDPKPEQIVLADIAHALSRIPRFNGHTITEIAWSVAQHSMLVERLMPENATPADRMVALLHDAHEAYIGDIVSPVLQAMDMLYKDEARPDRHDRRDYPPSEYINLLKRNLDVTIHVAFGLQPTNLAVNNTKRCDQVALAIEKHLFMAPCEREWQPLPPLPEQMPDIPEIAPPFEIAKQFLARFNILLGMRHGLVRE